LKSEGESKVERSEIPPRLSEGNRLWAVGSEAVAPAALG